MVKEVTHFIAENDPEETPFSNLQDAQRHENRIKTGLAIEGHLTAQFGELTRLDEIHMQDWVELVAWLSKEIEEGRLNLDL